MKTKLEAVSEIGRLIGDVVELFDSDDDVERSYLQQRLPAHLQALVATMPRSSVHLLATIDVELRAGRTVNVVGLAAQSGRLKGTVSKHVQRLVDAGLVRREPVPGNRKEIRLELTANGRQVVQVHREMRDEMDASLRQFLLRYTEEELAVATRMLHDLSGMRRDGVRLLEAPTGTGR